MRRIALLNILAAAFTLAVSAVASLAQDTQYPTRGQQIPVPDCLNLHNAWEGALTAGCPFGVHDRWLADIAHWRDTPLTPAMNIREAMKVFERTESEALAVVEDLDSRKVLGLLTEGYALRRYAEELDKARQGLSGGA